MRKKIFQKITVLFFCILEIASANEKIPKYGPQDLPYATLLKKERDFLRKSDADDFWALIPYYEGMREGHSASVASLSIILNGLRQNIKYFGPDELVIESTLLKTVKAENWANQIRGKKPKGVNLNQFGSIILESLDNYKLSDYKAEVIIIENEATETIDKVEKILIENEKTDSNFIIANYLQSAFTGDPEGSVGTYSPVAAYNATLKRVLILETDRKYYEPYWISLKTFVNGLSSLKTKDKINKSIGGLVFIQKK